VSFNRFNVVYSVDLRSEENFEFILEIKELILNRYFIDATILAVFGGGLKLDRKNLYTNHREFLHHFRRRFSC